MTTLPPTKLVKDVLDGMLGRETEVGPANAMATSDMVGGALAVYIDDSNNLVAVVGWDLSLAASVGAAVALVPKGAAEDAIEDQYLPENLLENLSEVSNVMASVFQAPGNPHLRLDTTYRPANMAPQEAIELLYALGNRLDLQVEVPGYGAGRISVSMRFV